MLTREENHVDHLLRGISEALDIPPSKYKQAVERYKSVGKHIEQGEYPGVSGEPECYCQGSFQLGTVVRPIKKGKESDYDIDLVAQLPQDKKRIGSGELKHMIGDRLKEDVRYKRMLQNEGKRCWTIQYAEEDGIGFHLDVLPAIPENSETGTTLLTSSTPHHIEKLAIAITNKNKEDKSYQWKSSNPAGYALWFREINHHGFVQVQMNERVILQEKYSDIYARVEDVPDDVIRTPLQRVIQLLKRHRDIRFGNHPHEKDKPISMIITTLATRVYESNPTPTLYETVTQVINSLKSSNHGGFITKKDGEWFIPNPVNAKENFADRWHENNSRKATMFFTWLDWLEQDIHQLINARDMKKSGLLLPAFFGERVASTSLNEFHDRFGDVAEKIVNRPRVTVTNESPSPWQRDVT